MHVRTELDPAEPDYKETVFDELVAVVQWGATTTADLLRTRIASREEARRMIAALTAALDGLK